MGDSLKNQKLSVNNYSVPGPCDGQKQGDAAKSIAIGYVDDNAGMVLYAKTILLWPYHGVRPGSLFRKSGYL
ncbi:hypothetical protein [Arsenicibacter rosenii]|uniref:Uncharacterized protein n=1 Tax=Arsenicibacter rosenii TaxID=1750698 RepID=A0A1S2VJV5_9BACT|nr:hypothetical protein [Arsenicibacter rosenii]OIN59013.1 hypothetical protein BLX24_12425 [Arsenicibacter rosenii]